MNLSQLQSKEIMKGYHGKMVHGQTITWAFWEVEKGAEVPQHNHVHEQIMHVLEGRFEFTVAGETNVYVPGDVVVIPSGTSHGGKALTTCKLMDVFSPAREEYR